jgi:transcriptional regulator with XRE-family HTH domain
MEVEKMFVPANRLRGYFTGMAAKQPSAVRATQKTTEPNSGIAAAFREAQEASGLKVKDLVEQVPCDESTVTNWRNGKVSRGSVQFERACSLMKVSHEDILAGRYVRATDPKPEPAKVVGPVDMFRELVGGRHHDFLVPMIEGLYRSELARRDQRPTNG